MSGLTRSSNPYLKGLKPKKYFSGLIELINYKNKIKDTRKFNPNWAIKIA